MNFRIADTFTDSLAHLTGDEQKAAKTTAFDLQLNPANPGMQLHKIDKSKDKNFWSVRVGSDIRLIVHKTSGSLLLCYVDHHDNAYDWARRRRLETHPKTGAAQFVEIRETVQEFLVPTYVAEAKPAPYLEALFAKVSDDELLSYGVPTEWLADVRAATEDSLLTLADHLPGEAAEALLELATGGKPAQAAADRGEGESFRSSRRAAPLPGDDQHRGAGTRARISVGQVDGLSSSGTAAMGRAGLHRAGAGFRFCWYGQDDSRAASGRVSGPQQPG